MKNLRALLALVTFGVALAGPACAAPAEDDTAADIGESEGAATATEADYTTWAPLVSAAGAEVNPRGLVTVLGVRGRSLDGTRHVVRSVQAYDDTFVVLLPTKRAIVLAGSTHPFQSDGVDGVPDVDKNGTRDVGRIRPGEYYAIGRGQSRLVGGLPGYDVVTYAGRSGRLPGIRDTNQDGFYDDGEDEASRARNDGLTAVLFHHGDRGAPAVVGCQVLSAESMKTLIKAVGGPAASFHYVLVDAPAD